MVLGIYGHGGLGREIAELARQINLSAPHWDQMIFIDDAQSVQDENPGTVIGFDAFSQLYSTEDSEIAIAIGEPAIREVLYRKVKSSGYTPATMIHPSCVMAQDAQVSEGCIICSNTFVSVNTKIGENVLVLPMASIAHDTQVEAHSVISSFASLAGHCYVGKCAYIGMSVPVKQGIRIGNHSIVGMGSVVLKDIPDAVVAIGNPARIMKKNEDNRVFRS